NQSSDRPAGRQGGRVEVGGGRTGEGGDDDAVAALGLRLVQGGVGGGAQGGGGGAVVGGRRHAERGRHRADHPAGVLQRQRLDALAQLLGAAPGVLQRRVGQRQQELLAAVPAGDILAADVRQQEAAQLPQHRVAGVVAEGV